MRLNSLLFVCVVAACVLLPWQAAAQNEENDAEYIVGCCIDKTIAPSEICSKAFCDKVKATQLAALEKKKETKAEQKADSNRDAQDEVLAAMATTKYTTQEVNIAALLKGEKEKDKLAIARFAQVSSLEKIKSKVNKGGSRNPVQADTELWPKGIISYKWSNALKPLSENLLHFVEDPLTVAYLRFGSAIGKWEKETCIRFDHNQAAGVVELEAGANSVTNRMGKSCTSVNVRKDDILAGFKHELGHCIGMDHTQKRSDRDTYVTVDPVGCATGLKNTRCASPASMGPAKPIAEAFCANEANKQYIKDNYVADYDKTDATKVAACVTGRCVDVWLHQYTEKSAFRTMKTYDKSSVMHYFFRNGEPLELCLKNPVNDGATPYNDISATDAAIVREAYGCLKWTVEYEEIDFFAAEVVTAKTKVIYVHPDWTLGEAAKYIRKSVGTIDGTLRKKVSGAWTQPVVLTASGYGDNAIVKLEPVARRVRKP